MKKNIKTIVEETLFSKDVDTGWNDNTVIGISIVKRDEIGSEWTNKVITISSTARHDGDSCSNFVLYDISKESLLELSEVFKEAADHLESFEKQE